MQEFTELPGQGTGPRAPASPGPTGREHATPSRGSSQRAAPQRGTTARYPIQDMAILAFGGGGGLARPFLTGAAASGARIAIVEKLPETGAEGEAAAEPLKAFAGELAQVCGHAVTVLGADVTDESEVAEAVGRIEELYGRIDVGVDFAGVAHTPFDLPQTDLSRSAAEFRKVLEINLTGAYIITAALARVMAPRRSGQIIHLCSNGSRVSLYGSYGYNASKHGVEGLVKTAAAQLAPLGVRVNAIAPGTVETDLNRFTLLRNRDGSFKPRAKSILAHTPTKRFATAEGVAATLLAMCIPQPHLTGNVIFADDGYNIEGHSWPEANEALYADRLEELLAGLDARYPREKG